MFNPLHIILIIIFSYKYYESNELFNLFNLLFCTDKDKKRPLMRGIAKLRLNSTVFRDYMLHRKFTTFQGWI